MTNQVNVPDKEADLPFTLHSLPLLHMLSDDAVLELHICGKRFAGEQRQERLANCLVWGSMHESQVPLPQDVLSRGMHGHEECVRVIVAEDTATDFSVCGEDHELATQAVPRQAWEGVPV